MTLEEIQARISELEMIRTVCCNCELSFGLQVYITGRLNNLNALKKEKINNNYKDGIRIDRIKKQS